MSSLGGSVRRRAIGRVAIVAGVIASLVPAASVGAQADPSSFPAPAVTGPIPGTVPGDPEAPAVADTYPFFSTWVDLAGNGYVEEEFYVDGLADGFATDGTAVAVDVPYRTRIVVRRPADDRDFNGTVLLEWQNVTAGYDLDALWSPDHMMRSGYAWVGVSAQRVGVNQLRTWSPARYGSLDVTGGGALRDRPALLRHLRPGRVGRARPGRGRAARRPHRRPGPGDRRVAIGRSDADLLRRRPAPGDARLRRLRLHRGCRAEPHRSRARVPGPLRDRRAVTGRPASRQRRVPALGGRRRPPTPATPARSTGRRSPSATSAASPSTSAAPRRSAASRSARS